MSTTRRPLSSAGGAEGHRALIGRGHDAAGEKLAGTRDAIGLVSDVGGAVAAASMLVAVVVGGVGTVVGIASDRPGVALVGGIFTAGVAVGAACMHTIEIHRSSSVESQLGYRWLQATYTYVIDASDPHHHSQVTDVVIKAIRDGVRTFSNQYRWSGSGDETVPTVTSSGHTLSGPVERSLAWRRYDVRLEPYLQKGETTTVSLLQQLYDTDERFELFLAKSVHDPTERLTLRVDLPIHLTPERAWCVTQVGAGPRARLVDREVIAPARDGSRAVLEWHVPRPAQGRSYQLRWDYASEWSLYRQHDSTMGERRVQASMRDPDPQARLGQNKPHAR
jgi:hypothetical protein